MFIGFNTTFLVQHSLGLLGMPRRIYTYDARNNWGVENMISTVGSFILAVGVLLTVLNLVRSLKVGQEGGQRPVEREYPRVVRAVAAP